MSIIIIVLAISAIISVGICYYLDKAYPANIPDPSPMLKEYLDRKVVHIKSRRIR